MTWIDWLVFATLIVGFYCGWRVGVIAEAFDAGALVVGLLAASLWSTAVATGLPPDWSLSDASRYLVAFWLLFLLVYALVRVGGWFVMSRIDRRDNSWISSTCGGLLSVAKVLAAMFVILYLALFLPMDGQLRDTIHHSFFANQLDRGFQPINDRIVDMSPKLYKLIVRPIMHDHRV
jgi:uncharacterized membrane protein required for colicin V production